MPSQTTTPHGTTRKDNNVKHSNLPGTLEGCQHALRRMQAHRDRLIRRHLDQLKEDVRDLKRETILTERTTTP